MRPGRHSIYVVLVVLYIPSGKPGLVLKKAGVMVALLYEGAAT